MEIEGINLDVKFLKQLSQKTTGELEKITKNIPIALVADREADEFQAKRVGADFFVVKPVSKTKLNKFFNLN